MATDLDTPEARKRYVEQSVKAIDAGWVPTGIRLVNPKKPEEGRVVLLEEDEAAAVMPALRKALQGRVRASRG